MATSMVVAVEGRGSRHGGPWKIPWRSRFLKRDICVFFKEGISCVTKHYSGLLAVDAARK